MSAAPPLHYPYAGYVAVETAADNLHAIVNPVVIVEVLSPSTEEYDRGDKLEAYKQVAALREVVLVARDAPRIDVWRRADDGWRRDSYGARAHARLQSVDRELAVDDLFRDPLATA